MANAKPEDTRTGWEIYKASNYSLSLEDLNHALERRGFGQISDRSYRHLRKLERYGYDRYVPTNQLDVETLRDPVWDTPLRSRYLSRRTEMDVIVALLSDGELQLFKGKVVELSELEATIRLTNGDASSWLQKPSKDGKAALVLLGVSNDSQPVVIEDTIPEHDDTSSVIVTVKFLGVISTNRYIPGEVPLPIATLRMTIEVENSAFLLNTVRTLNVVVTAVESVRIGCEEVLANIDSTGRYILTPPEIVTLSRENPIHLVLSTPEKVAALFVWLLRVFVKSKVELDHSRTDDVLATATASIGSAQAEAIKESTRTRRIVNDALEDTLRNNPKAIVDVFVREIAKALPGEVARDAGAIGASERLGILAERQILPAIADLSRHPIETLIIESDAEVPTDDPWKDEAGEAPTTSG